MAHFVSGHRMAAVDAQFYWVSAKIPSDEFLLYAFDDEPADYPRAVARLRERANAEPTLTIRVQDRGRLRYPHWVPTAVTSEQVLRHDLADDSWDGCLAAVVGLADDQLDIRRMAWRVHLFSPVRGIPGVAGAGAVAVFQVAHALADGARSAAMAAWLFGRPDPVPRVPTARPGFLPWRAAQAARAHRRLQRDIRGGLLAPKAGPRPLLPTNARPDGARAIRTLVRHRSQVRGPTVTVGVLSAVARALPNFLGEQCDSLGAEVPMAKPGTPQAYNHFGNIVVGLYPKLGPQARAERIATDLTNGRLRFEHPATRAADRAFAAVPAGLLHWGIEQFDPQARATQVSGNTVVSSVNRGPADLNFGGARVVLTSGYPALSPMMGLTHGVHGIGDTIAISVHAAASAVPDVDAYLSLLDAEL